MHSASVRRGDSTEAPGILEDGRCGSWFMGIAGLRRDAPWGNAGYDGIRAMHFGGNSEIVRKSGRGDEGQSLRSTKRDKSFLLDMYGQLRQSGVTCQSDDRPGRHQAGRRQTQAGTDAPGAQRARSGAKEPEDR